MSELGSRDVISYKTWPFSQSCRTSNAKTLNINRKTTSAAEEGLVARGNNNAEQAVRDHKRSAEDSFVHHHCWSPSVATGERKEERRTETLIRMNWTERPFIFHELVRVQIGIQFQGCPLSCFDWHIGLRLQRAGCKINCLLIKPSCSPQNKINLTWDS